LRGPHDPRAVRARRADARQENNVAAEHTPAGTLPAVAFVRSGEAALLRRVAFSRAGAQDS